jgi:6,7-dimethyl-8-ribityllumazine synthase
MSSSIQNLSAALTEQVPSGEGLKFGIIRSEWNTEITNALQKGCYDFLIEKGASADDIKCVDVPGSYELPMGAKILMGTERYDAIICIGCVIKGETKHDEYISNAVANAIAQLGILSSIPVIFGVLTPNNMEQALERSGGKHGNKGIEAAATAIKMAVLRKENKNVKKSIGF